MMKRLLYRYNPWWDSGFEFTNIIERYDVESQLRNTLNDKSIVFLTGLRRIGKTTLMKLLIRYLINEKGICSNHIMYVSVDDYLLKDNTLTEIIDEYRKIHKIPFDKLIFLFFDEITYQQDYELQLKNLYDSQNVKVYASSSSASLLKKRKSLLTGRHHTFEISPLTFNEYLIFKNIIIKGVDEHLRDSYFVDYLKCGGMPEYVLNNNVEYLKNLVDDIIMKDIAAMHNIKNTSVLKDYFLLLMERSGKQLSINKISLILNVSPDTSRRYFDLFVDTFLIYSLPRYGKTNSRILSPKKIYACDLGVRNLFTGYRDWGSMFENYVFLQLKDRGLSYVYDNAIEIDFITDHKELIEVKYHNEELSEKQRTLFEKTIATSKYIIRNQQDLENFISKD